MSVDLVPGAISISTDATIEATHDVVLDGRTLGSLLHVHRLTPAGPDIVLDRSEWTAYDVDHREVGGFGCIHDAIDAVTSSHLIRA